MILDAIVVSPALGTHEKRLYLAVQTPYQVVLPHGGGYEPGARCCCVDAGQRGWQISPQRGPHGLQDSLVDVQSQGLAGVLQRSSVSRNHYRLFNKGRVGLDPGSTYRRSTDEVLLTKSYHYVREACGKRRTHTHTHTHILWWLPTAIPPRKFQHPGSALHS